MRHFLVPAARIRWRIYVHTLPFLPYPHEIMDDLDYLSYTLIDNRLSPYHRGMIRLRRQHLPHARLVDTRSHLTSLARKSTGTRNDYLCTAATIPRCPILYPLLCLLVSPKMEIDPFLGYLCGVAFASWCLKLCGFNTGLTVYLTMFPVDQVFHQVHPRKHFVGVYTDDSARVRVSELSDIFVHLTSCYGVRLERLAWCGTRQVKLIVTRRKEINGMTGSFRT